MFAVDIVAQDLVHSWTLGSCPDINRGLAYAHTRVDTVKGTSALVELFFKNSRMVEAGRQAGSSIPDRPPLFFAPLFEEERNVVRSGREKKEKEKENLANTSRTRFISRHALASLEKNNEFISVALPSREERGFIYMKKEGKSILLFQSLHH